MNKNIILRINSTSQRNTCALATSSGTLSAYVTNSLTGQSMNNVISLNITGAGTNSNDVTAYTWRGRWEG